MKTPDEIKKALECCFYDSEQCMDCPYYPISCDRELVRDAREYIRQLEAERDAAVRDLTEMAQDTDESCEYCEMFKTPNCSRECRMKNKGFKWRGVQKEE